MVEVQPDSFGQKLQQERKIHRWTQEQLAEHIGASVPSVNRWEHDKTVPRTDMLEELTRVFGRPPGRWGTNRWWNVPYPRNLYFTGREQVLQRLQKALVSGKSGDSCKIRAISGLGGIGKTQTAIEFAYRNADEYDAVLWVRAGSRETMNADFASLAKTLNLPDKEKMNQFQAIEAVKNWLLNYDRWLLIFDNADNVDNVAMVFNVLPRRYSGAVLLTTCSQHAEPHIKAIEMEKLSQSEGVTFLLLRTSTDENVDSEENLSAPERNALYKLWEVMDGLPLALDQAGAYIKTAQCSFHKYVALYSKHRKALLVERGSHNPEHQEAVATTWELSFQRIERENPAAAELLRLCAFLAPDAIPEQLIVWGTAHCTPQLEKLAVSDKSLNDAIKTLHSYSLLQRDPTTQTLQIHRLVQAVLIDDMSVEVRNEWKQRVIHILNAAFPEAPFQEWGRCGQLLPHVQTCAIEIEHEPKGIQLEAADLFDRTGSYLREQGQYIEAESLLKLALLLRKQHLRADDLAIATSLSSLAGLYFYQDSYREATPLVKSAFAIRQQRLGAEHPETIESLKHLALLYLRQEQYEQAEPLLRQSLSISERSTGHDSLATANIMSSLAILYLEQGQYDRAEPLLKKAFSINKRHLGAKHPATARTMENLAFLYLKQGRYRRVEPLLYRAFSIHALYSGFESPDIAYPLFGLAELYRVQKQYEPSELFHLRVLSIRQQCLGEKHLDTAESLQGLADLYRESARYEEAAPFYVQALTIREKILGWESPSILKARQTYVAMLQIQDLSLGGFLETR